MKGETEKFLAFIVGVFALISIWNGADMMSGCLRSATYLADTEEKLGTNPFVAAAVMMVVGSLIMAFIATKEEDFIKKKSKADVVKPRRERYKPKNFTEILLLEVALVQIMMGAKMVSNCIETPAYMEVMAKNVGVNPILFAGGVIVWGCFLIAWITTRKRKGAGK